MERGHAEFVTDLSRWSGLRGGRTMMKEMNGGMYERPFPEIRVCKNGGLVRKIHV